MQYTYKMYLLIVLSIFASLNGCQYARTPQVAQSEIDRGKFVPDEQKLLMFIGQDSETIEHYIETVSEDSIEGVTLYTSLIKTDEQGDLPALTRVGNWGAGDTNFQQTLNMSPQAALAIGLSLADCPNEHLSEIIKGQYDSNISKLVNYASSIAPREIFLRIGYEFDGPWNCYSPEKFKRAYRYIVEKFSDKSISNVAFVWQSAVWPDASIAGEHESRYDHQSPHFLSRWYPGDDVVDWIGISVFYRDTSQWNYDPPDSPERAQAALLAFARQHKKPVMVAEASPQGFHIANLTRSPIQINQPVAISANEIWNAWYQPFFEFIYQNRDVIRAVAYINTFWESQPMWFCAEQAKAGSSQCPSGNWGDARVQANPLIKQQWLEHVNNADVWVQGNK